MCSATFPRFHRHLRNCKLEFATVGGLAMGLLLGACLAPWLTERTPVRRRAERILFAAAALFLAGMYVLVKRVNGYVVPLAKAQKEIVKGDGRATHDLEAAVQHRPNDATPLRMLGITYLQGKDYPKAEAAFQRLVQLRPDDLSARYDLGIAHGAAGRYAEAEQVFAELTHLDPGNDDFWLLFGSSLKDLHRPEEAQQAFEKVLHLNPQNYQAHREIGWLQFESINPDAALESFQRAVKIEPKDADSYLGLSRAYAAKDMKRESAAAFERYQELRPPESKMPAAK
jgi:tetratricopeptide (TPR) repeat protein